MRRDEDLMNVKETGAGACSSRGALTRRSRTRGVTSVDNGC